MREEEMKIISGAQTGVDRAALDAAMAFGMDVGGWCPRGRKALDGIIPPKYPLQETKGASYQTRTKWNVRDADATLILCMGEPSGGTALTIKYCEQLGKPYHVHRLNSEWGTYIDGDGCSDVLYWMNCHDIHVLNVAGPREGKHGPVYDQAYYYLKDLFQQILISNDDICEPMVAYG